MPLAFENLLQQSLLERPPMRFKANPTDLVGSFNKIIPTAPPAGWTSQLDLLATRLPALRAGFLARKGWTEGLVVLLHTESFSLHIDI